MIGESIILDRDLRKKKKKKSRKNPDIPTLNFFSMLRQYKKNFGLMFVHVLVCDACFFLYFEIW